MTKFEKPLSKSWDYPEMGREAVSAALKDSKLKYEDVQAVVASYCYGDPACGQRVVYGEGVLLAG
jgi:sterol carrier protein 2